MQGRVENPRKMIESFEYLIKEKFSDPNKAKLLKCVRNIEIRYSQEVIRLLGRWYYENIKQENKAEINAQLQCLLEMLATKKSFMQALNDKTLPPIEQLLKLILQDKLDNSWFFRLKDLDVLKAIQNETLSIIDVLKWTDQWKYSLFNSELANKINRFALLNALCHPAMIEALQKKKIGLNEIKERAQSNMSGMADLLNVLNAQNHIATPVGRKLGYGLKYIMLEKITFKDVFELVDKHGIKEVVSFIKMMNAWQDPWLQSKMQPKELFQSVLNYDGHLQDLTDQLWRASSDEVFEFLQQAQYSAPRLC